jgi:O-antigen ligase
MRCRPAPGRGRLGPCQNPEGVAARLDPKLWLWPVGLAGLAAIVGLIAGISPAAAIGGSLALVFALVAFSDLTLGVVGFMPIMFFQAGSLSKLLIAPTLILVVAAIAKVTTARSTGARVKTLLSEHHVGAALLLLLLCWTALSATWARSSSDAYLDVARYALNIALFFVVFVAMQTRKQAAWILAGYIAAASLITVVGPSLRPGFLAPQYSNASLASPENTRFIGSLGDPNELAAVLLPGLALSVGAVGALRGHPGARLGAAAAGLICLVAILLTASRGGLIGLTLALVAALVFAGRWRATAIFAAVILVVTAFTYFGAYASESTRERIIQPTQGEDKVQESRLTLWQVGWRMVEDHPIAGVGVGNFSNVSIDYVLRPGETFRTDVVIDEHQAAHNTYLHVLAEVGVVGAGLFVGIIVFSLASTVRAAWNFRDLGDTAMEIMSRALLVGQIGMLGAIFFFSAQSVNKVWIVLAFGPAMLAVSRAGRSVEPARPAPGRI